MSKKRLDENGEERIECLLCGRWFHRLDVHLTRVHGVDVEAYKKRYPGVPTISQWAKATAARGQQRRRSAELGAGKKPGTTKAVVEQVEVETQAAITEGVFKIGVATLVKRHDLEPCDLAYVPTHDPNFIFGEVEMLAWEDLAIAIEDNHPVYISGPTGCGKTASVNELGAVVGQPVCRIQLNRDFRVGEFVGRATLEIDSHGNQVTGWRDGVLTEAMRHGWWLLLDEVDQAHPDVLMKLQAVLEGAPLVLTENFGEVVTPHKHFRIIATANTLGRGDGGGLYVGAKIMNEATLDRFGTVIRADYPTRDTEIKIVKQHSGIDNKLAEKMVSVARKVRKALAKEEICCTFSTRRLIAWACRAVRFGGDVRRAAQATVLNKVEPDDEAFLNELLQRYFGGGLA